MPDQATYQDGIKVGLAERVITPPLGGAMAGYAARKGVSQGVHDDLHVRALAVEGPEATVAVLSASVISLSQEVIDGVREEAERRTGMPGVHVMMASTHTHSGPTLTKEYAAFLKDRCVECLTDAWARREEGRLGVGIGLEVKHRSPFRKTLVVGLANAGKTGGYLPTREAFGEGDYEVLASGYSEDAGEILVEATLKQLAQLRHSA